MQADERSDGQDAGPGQDVLPLLEERLRVDKRAVATGRVSVRTVTEAFEDIARVALSTSEVEITRVPVGRTVDAPPPVREEDGVTVVPVLEEVAVVETRLVLKEELHIRTRTRTETVDVPVTLRRQRARVERSPAEDPPPARGPSRGEEPSS